MEIIIQPEPDINITNMISLNQSKESIPILPHRLNDIQFWFSAPFYDDEQKNLFSYKLDGYSDDYSAWSSSEYYELY